MSWLGHLSPSLCTRSLSVAFLGALSLFACSSDDPKLDENGDSGDKNGSTGATNTSTTPGGKLNATYWQDIAPIYATHCVSCHQEGGIAPFALDSYASASQNAAPSAHAVSSRTMPPWLLVGDGSCQEFQDSKALTQAQIDTIVAWSKNGTPEGTPATIEKPKPDHLQGGIDVMGPMFTPMPEGSELAKYDEYRCFLLDNPSPDKERYITGYEFFPGNPALVHHALLLIVPGDQQNGAGKTNDEAIKELDEKSPDRLGWPCFSFAGDGVVPSDVPIVWAPGQGPVRLRQDAGHTLKPSDRLVMQVHYNMVDPAVIGQSDQSKVKLQLAENVGRQSFTFLWDDLIETLAHDPVQIPPGQEKYEYVMERSFEEFDLGALPFIDLHGFFPHMHQAGTGLTVEHIRDGQTSCIGKLQRWDFDWQLFYPYKEPIRFQKGDRLRATCTFNTMDRDTVTTPGWGTYNEMCLAGFQLMLPPSAKPR